MHAWALTVNRSQGQTLDKILIDLRHAPFAHGQAYVAISRVHVAADCGAFVNERCCIECAGVRRAVLGNVVYEELLALPTNAVPPAAGASAPASNPRRPRLADLLPMLDDCAQATRVCKRVRVPLTDSRKLARSESRMTALLCAGVP